MVDDRSKDNRDISHLGTTQGVLLLYPWEKQLIILSRSAGRGLGIGPGVLGCSWFAGQGYVKVIASVRPIRAHKMYMQVCMYYI